MHLTYDRIMFYVVMKATVWQTDFAYWKFHKSDVEIIKARTSVTAVSFDRHVVHIDFILYV